MAIHRLYLSDETGQYNGFERLNVQIDADGNLRIGHRLTLPVASIRSCVLTPVVKEGKGEVIELTACSPKLNGGQPTTIYLVHKNFWGNTKREPMNALVEELAPLIEQARIERQAEPVVDPVEAPMPAAGVYEVRYVFNLSILIVFYHSEWAAFDGRRKALAKTCLLLLAGALLNILGILLFVLPRDHWRMCGNFERIGCSRGVRLAAYVVSLLIPVGIWLAGVIPYL